MTEIHSSCLSYQEQNLWRGSLGFSLSQSFEHYQRDSLHVDSGLWNSAEWHKFIVSFQWTTPEETLDTLSGVFILEIIHLVNIQRNKKWSTMSSSFLGPESLALLELDKLLKFILKIHGTTEKMFK